MMNPMISHMGALRSFVKNDDGSWTGSLTIDGTKITE